MLSIIREKRMEIGIEDIEWYKGEVMEYENWKDMKVGIKNGEEERIGNMEYVGIG